MPNGDTAGDGRMGSSDTVDFVPITGEPFPLMAAVSSYRVAGMVTRTPSARPPPCHRSTTGAAVTTKSARPDSS